MATLLTPEGRSLTILPDNGKEFSLEEMYRHIGCECVECVHLPDGRDMWVDEDGKSNQALRPNELASKLLLLAGGIDRDFVVGNALLTTLAETGDGEGGDA